MRQHIAQAMQQLTTNDMHSLRYSVPSIQRILQEDGYIAGIDRVAHIVWAIQHEETDAEEKHE